MLQWNVQGLHRREQRRVLSQLYEAYCFGVLFLQESTFYTIPGVYEVGPFNIYTNAKSKGNLPTAIVLHESVSNYYIKDSLRHCDRALCISLRVPLVSVVACISSHMYAGSDQDIEQYQASLNDVSDLIFDVQNDVDLCIIGSDAQTPLGNFFDRDDTSLDLSPNLWHIGGGGPQLWQIFFINKTSAR